MSSEIQFRDASAPTDPDASLLLRYENTVNAPIVSATWLANGEAIAGYYTISATSGSAVDITAEDPKNEFVQSGKSVVADGATANLDVIPGVSIVFSATLANGWIAKLSIGALMDTGGNASKRLNVGTIESGALSTQRRIAARNVGDEDSTETEVFALPGFYVSGTSVAAYIKFLKNHTDPARHDILIPGDYVLTFADYVNAATDTVDVYVNKDGGGANKAIEDGELNETLYQYGVTGYIDGGDYLPGLGIAFLDNGDPTAKTFTIHARDGNDWVEFAPDSSGAPGTWQSGPLTLTELGETTGTITAGGHAFFWIRVNVPDSADPGDMRLVNLRARGLTV